MYITFRNVQVLLYEGKGRERSIDNNKGKLKENENGAEEKRGGGEGGGKMSEADGS